MSDLSVYENWGADDYNVWSSNATWVQWPTYDELLDYLELNSYASASGHDPGPPRPVIVALDAAISRIAERCRLRVLAVDTAGALKDPKELATVPPEVKQAALMHAARLYRRRTAIEGVVGASELGGTIRYEAFDRDVEALLANWIVYGLA